MDFETLALSKQYTDQKIKEAQFSGDGYVLTEADKQEIAELTAPLVDVPSGGAMASGKSLETSPWKRIPLKM